MSQRAGLSQLQNLDNLKFIAEKCVSFIINKDGAKIPIKRSVLHKFINSFHIDGIKKVDTVLQLTNAHLKQVYGYKLVQIEGKGGVHYITILEPGVGPSHSVDAQQMNALLVASLVHIFMSGGTLKDDALWRFLEKSGLMAPNDTNIKRILTNHFTKQAYLTYTKVGEADNGKYVFEWGERAEEEFPKLKLLEKLGEIFERNPDYWFEQHKIATAQRGSVQETE